MTATELALVKATQHGLPLVPRPYQAVADELGIGEEKVISLLRAMLADGRIRRIGAVPNHYALGYSANAMSVWDVLDEAVDALGPRVGALPFVTHCYRRPRRLPDWPYNLFAMVHGRSRDETAGKIEAIRATLGRSLRGSDVLYSTRMLKKTGLRML
ncbi:MAG TPA: Lrp/AsnC family transcriptional regulator [Burkholderiales bacterium]|nr:Lrp/AsnC family transcriptional regulator [Burkholderiales bacterium]